MRFVGQTEVAAFLASSPAYDNTVRAWVAEMKSGQWHSATALAADFHNVDVSALPWVVFYLLPSFGAPHPHPDRFSHWRRHAVGH